MLPKLPGRLRWAEPPPGDARSAHTPGAEGAEPVRGPPAASSRDDPSAPNVRERSPRLRLAEDGRRAGHPGPTPDAMLCTTMAHAGHGCVAVFFFLAVGRQKVEWSTEHQPAVTNPGRWMGSNPPQGT